MSQSSELPLSPVRPPACHTEKAELSKQPGRPPARGVEPIHILTSASSASLKKCSPTHNREALVLSPGGTPQSRGIFIFHAQTAAQMCQAPRVTPTAAKERCRRSPCDLPGCPWTEGGDPLGPADLRPQWASESPGARLRGSFSAGWGGTREPAFPASSRFTLKWQVPGPHLKTSCSEHLPIVASSEPRKRQGLRPRCSIHSQKLQLL